MQLVVDNQEELLEQPLVEEIIKESLADQVEEPVVASIDKEAVFEPFVAADKGILTVSNKKLFYFYSLAIISKIDLTNYFAIFFLSVKEEELTKPEIIADDEVAKEQPAHVLIETPAVFVPKSIENTKVVEDIIIAKI